MFKISLKDWQVKFSLLLRPLQDFLEDSKSAKETQYILKDVAALLPRLDNTRDPSVTEDEAHQYIGLWIEALKSQRFKDFIKSAKKSPHRPDLDLACFLDEALKQSYIKQEQLIEFGCVYDNDDTNSSSH